jgi:hypothetical protein
MHIWGIPNDGINDGQPPIPQLAQVLSSELKCL